MAAIAIVSCLLAACGGGGGGGSTPATPAIPGQLSLDFKTVWNDTGVALVTGKTVTVTASGSFNNGQCGSATTCITDPNGKPWSDCVNLPPPPFTAPGLPCYSLIGKIGANGAPFEVGSSFSTVVTTPGELFLAANDNYYQDNSGTWTVDVTQS